MLEEVWKNYYYFGAQDSYRYQISSYGRVKALPKTVYFSDGRTRNYKEQLLKPRVDGKGYMFVTIFAGLKVSIQLRVHRMVAETFISNPDNKPCVNHKDRNRKNNRLDNLEWVTYSENTLHYVNTGEWVNPTLKLSEEIVKDIRLIYGNGGGLRQWQIAKMFGIKQPQVSRIINFKNW
jgi:hypothetical protein